MGKKFTQTTKEDRWIANTHKKCSPRSEKCRSDPHWETIMRPHLTYTGMATIKASVTSWRGLGKARTFCVAGWECKSTQRPLWQFDGLLKNRTWIYPMSQQFHSQEKWKYRATHRPGRKRSVQPHSLHPQSESGQWTSKSRGLYPCNRTRLSNKKEWCD